MKLTKNQDRDRKIQGFNNDILQKYPKGTHRIEKG